MSVGGSGSIIRRVLAAVVVMAVLILVASVSALVGTLLMLAYSGRAVVRAYRQDLPLTWLTCLLPASMAVGCFALQLMAFAPSNVTYVLIGAGAGVGFGILLGRSHKVFARERLVYARQTSTYLVFWVLINIATQLSGMVGWREVADLALASGALTTAAVATLHLMLLYRSGSVQASFVAEHRRAVSSLTLIGAAAAFAFALVPAAYALYTVSSAREALSLALQPSDFGTAVTVREVPVREAIARQTQLPPGVLTALGMGTRWDVAANVYSAQIGPTLLLQSNLVLFYAPSTIGILRDLQYAAVRGLARSFGVWGQEWERSDPGHRQYNPRTADCGEYCTEMSYECGYLAVRSTGNWHVIFLLALATRPPAGVFGAEPGDPAPEVCARYQVPGSGRRLLSLIDQRLGQLDYQGSVASSVVRDPAAMAGIVGALLQLLAAFGSAGAAAAAQSAAAAAQVAASRAAQAVAGGRPGAPQAAGSAPSAATTSTETPTGTRILDGAEAEAWLKKHNYLKPTGERDDRFTAFMNSLLSESAPGLQTFAGDLDAEGNPTGHYAIVVTDVPSEPEPPPEPPPPPTIVWPPNSEEQPPPEPEPTGPSATQLRDRWRAQERALKQEIDHKTQRMTELKDTLQKLEHEYNITRYAACSDAVIDALDIAVQVALKTSQKLAETALNRLDTEKVSGAWWKELIKGGIKESFRGLIRYAETGELKRPEFLQRLLDCYGAKTDAPPGGALKQWLLNTLEKKTGSKDISDPLGLGEDFYSIYRDTVENMEKSGRLRSQINTNASEYRELDSDVRDLTDEYSKVRAWADLAERDIAAMKKPRHEI